MQRGTVHSLETKRKMRAKWTEERRRATSERTLRVKPWELAHGPRVRGIEAECKVPERMTEEATCQTN
jgi:hypothetical protein